MKKSILIPALALVSLFGCSQPQQAAVPSQTVQKSTTVSTDDNGQKRTDGTYQSSHADADSSRASVQVSASKTDPSGATSSHTSVVKVASEGDAANTLGFSQDDKNIAVSGSNTTKEIVANGQDVRVSGSNNTLVFKGSAHGFSVTGSDNKVTVENPQILDVAGKNNQVTYSGKAPQIKKTGEGNVVNAR